MTDTKKAASAAEAEAASIDMITTKWREITLEIPAAFEDWPVDAAEASEEIAHASLNGDPIRISMIRRLLKSLLGPAQWGQVTRKQLSLSEFNELGTLLLERSGEVTPGE